MCFLCAIFQKLLQMLKNLQEKILQIITFMNEVFCAEHFCVCMWTEKQ